MANFFPYVLDAAKQCEETCAKLLECLKEEKTALVTLQMESIIQSNLKKESLTLSLRRKQAHLKDLIRAHYSVETLPEVSQFLNDEDKKTWTTVQDTWKNQWSEITTLCESNQVFIRHSLKNLGLIVENLKRLFGMGGRYSQTGNVVSATGEGKVIEARY